MGSSAIAQIGSRPNPSPVKVDNCGVLHARCAVVAAVAASVFALSIYCSAVPFGVLLRAAPTLCCSSTCLECANDYANPRSGQIRVVCGVL